MNPMNLTRLFLLVAAAGFFLAPVVALQAQSVSTGTAAGGGGAGDAPRNGAVLTAPNTTGTGPLFGVQSFFDGFAAKRAALEEKGCTFAGTLTGDLFGNPVGGAKRGVVPDGLLELDLTLDFKKMTGWDGVFHASSLYPMGNSLSDGYTNDLFGVNSIAGYNTFHLFELWYEQKACDDKVSLRIGQLAADTEFFVSNAGANFLNATYGWPAVLAQNVPTPNYPYAAPGIRLRADPSEHWSFLSAVFAGNPAPDRIGDPNPSRRPGNQFDNSGAGFYFNRSDGVFNINELWYKLNGGKEDKGLPGTYKLGAWVHTGAFSNKRYDTSGMLLASPASNGHPRAAGGNFGFYGIADQAVWRDKSNEKQPKEIDLFLRAGNARADRSVFDYYADGGATFAGFVRGRPNDLFGIAAGYGDIAYGLLGFVEGDGFNGPARIPAGYEANIELTYHAQLTSWCAVQPDIQILLHPGGSGATPNALVLGCRLIVTF